MNSVKFLIAPFFTEHLRTTAHGIKGIKLDSPSDPCQPDI